MEGLEAASGQLIAAWPKKAFSVKSHMALVEQGLRNLGHGEAGVWSNDWGKGQGNKDCRMCRLPWSTGRGGGGWSGGVKKQKWWEKNKVVSEVKVKAGPWSLKAIIQLEVETEVWSATSTLPRAEELHHSEYPLASGSVPFGISNSCLPCLEAQKQTC